MEKPIGYLPPSEQNNIKKEPMKVPEGGKITTCEVAENKSEDGLSANSIFRRIQKPTRRDFVKIAIGLVTGYVVNKEIDSMLTEYQKEKIPKTINESEYLQKSTELLENMAEYAEMIEKSKKQPLEEFAKDLSKKDFDNLILGERHGFGPTSEKAADLLEELLKNNKKISAICFEQLSYTDPEHVEATKKFNNGELSPEEMFKHVNTKLPLLELARKYSIEIKGVEKEKIEIAEAKPDGHYRRLKEISERIGDISKEKNKEGIIVTSIGQGHVTADSWIKDVNSINFYIQLNGRNDFYPSKEASLKNNYTIKEYLEKINMKPVAVQIDEWRKFIEGTYDFVATSLMGLPPNEKKTFYDRAINKWPSFILKEKDVFVAPYPNAKENTYAMIIPGKISDKPHNLR